MAEPIFVGKAEAPVTILPKMSNRHGLITGATGTGKTVTLQILTEGFSRIGVPVFVADVKGDFSGVSQVGGGKEVFEKRAADIGLTPYEHFANPVTFWDLYGQKGHPIRTTISAMGPLLLARILELNDVQEGVLNVAFKFAEDQKLPIIDLKDLRAVLTHLGENTQDVSVRYGNVSTATVGTIQRALLVIEQQGGEGFFGEPSLDLADMMRTDANGKGMVNVLASDKLINSPKLYSTFLLWMIDELFEKLPEVGDPDQPKMVFFFDEAHLLFSDATPSLLKKVEQVVKLIRSKGVGIYFCTQNPIDIPDTVLSQLGNRFQHALRAYTPRDQKAVQVAATTFRPNPKFKTEEVITQLGVGEALVSVLDEKGTPTVVEKTLIRPPASRVGPATDEERQQILRASTMSGKYDQTVDRESAFEKIQAVADRAAEEKADAEQAEQVEKEARRPASRRSDTVGETITKTAVRSLAPRLLSGLIKLVPVILGALVGSKKRRR